MRTGGRRTATEGVGTSDVEIIRSNFSGWIGAFGEISAGVIYFTPRPPRVVLCDYWGTVRHIDLTVRPPKETLIKGVCGCCWTRKDGELECILRREGMPVPAWVSEADVVLFDETDSTVMGLMEVKTTSKPRMPASFHCQSGWADTEREARTRSVPTWFGLVRLNPAFPREEVIVGQTKTLRPPEEVFRSAIAMNRLTDWVSEVCIYGPEGYEILNREPGGFVIRSGPGASPTFRWPE